MNLIPASASLQPPSNTLSGNASSTQHTQQSLNTSSLLGFTPPTHTALEGKILTGEVIDLKRNEVTIKLSENETITASLPQNTELKMGQKITFQVVIDPSNKPTIQLMNTLTSPLHITIQEALEAAGLPKSDRNQAIVRELLNYQMSIDKQSIQNLFRNSIIYKNASLSSLVLMAKHNIPFTEANVGQFENYRNYEHRIVKEIETLSNSLPSLISDVGRIGSFKEMTTLNNQILDLLLASDSSAETTNTIPTLILSGTSNKELLGLLNQYPLSDQLRGALLNGTANLTDVITVLKQDYELSVQSDAAKLEIIMLQEDVDPTKLMLTQDAFKSPLVNQILEQYNTYQQELGQIGGFLKEEARNTLLSELKGLPLPSELKQTISTGTITTKDLLTMLRAYLPTLDDANTTNILSSNSYKSLLKEHLLSQWTMTSKTLTTEDSVPNFYDKMYTQLSEIENLTSQLNNSHEIMNEMNSIPKSLNNIIETKQNLDFMKSLNELFTYVQLPLRFKDKTVHSDLYVYTNKKELKKNKDTVSALLHLDMDYLGSLDIHVNLNFNQVTSRFYLETNEAIHLVSEHIDELQEALQNKGYLLNSEILKKEKEIDIVEDFIEKGTQINSLQRYSFDIRT